MISHACCLRWRFALQRAVPWRTNWFIYDPSTGSINGEKLSRKILTWLHQLRGATGPGVIPRLYDSRQKKLWVFGCGGLKSIGCPPGSGA